MLLQAGDVIAHHVQIQNFQVEKSKSVTTINDQQRLKAEWEFSPVHDMAKVWRGRTYSAPVRFGLGVKSGALLFPPAKPAFGDAFCSTPLSQFVLWESRVLQQLGELGFGATGMFGQPMLAFGLVHDLDVVWISRIDVAFAIPLHRSYRLGVILCNGGLLKEGVDVEIVEYLVGLFEKSGALDRDVSGRAAFQSGVIGVP
jgi:hypothetical protein